MSKIENKMKGFGSLTSRVLEVGLDRFDFDYMESIIRRVMTEENVDSKIQRFIWNRYQSWKSKLKSLKNK